MFNRNSFTLPFVFAFVAVACASSSGSGTTTGTSEIVEDSFCDELAEAMCNGSATCCSAPVMTQEECLREVKVSCTFDILWGLEDSDYDAGRAAGLVSSIQQATKTCKVFEMPYRTDVRRLRYPKLGEQCGEDYPEENFICPESSFCTYSAAAGMPVCTARGVEGDLCGGDNQLCAVGFNCEGGQGIKARCVRRLSEGESCTDQYGGYKVCLDGLECIAMSETAAECHPPRASGGMCLSYSDCRSQWCSAENDAAVGTCKACANDADCGGAYCVKGVCTLQAPKADGAACVYEEECTSGELPTKNETYCFSADDVQF